MEVATEKTKSPLFALPLYRMHIIFLKKA